MDTNIVVSYKILLTYICNDKKKLTGIINTFQSNGNTRRKQSDLNTKVADNVSVFLKSGRVTLAINALKVKSNQHVSEELLCLIVVAYGIEVRPTDQVEYNEIEKDVNIENAPGYLAYFILHDNADACTQIGKIMEAKLKTDNEKKQMIANELSSKKADIEQKKLKKFEKENERVKRKNIELENKLEEFSKSIKLLTEKNQSSHDSISELTAKNEELWEENKKLNLSITHLKKQIQELTASNCKSNEPDAQTIKEEIYFYGSKWGLPESEDYTFNIVPKEFYLDFPKVLEKGFKVWVVIIEVPLQIKRIVRQYSGQKNLMIFETKRDLADYLGNK